MDAEPSPQNGQLQTPVSAESLKSLRNQIEQDAHLLPRPEKLRFQKLANAAETSFGDCALLRDQNKLSFEQNNERRIRLSTKLAVISGTKVMSYEDIVETKRRRAVKEVSGGKGLDRVASGRYPCPKQRQVRNHDQLNVKMLNARFKSLDLSNFIRFCSFEKFKTEYNLQDSCKGSGLQA